MTILPRSRAPWVPARKLTTAVSALAWLLTLHAGTTVEAAFPARILVISSRSVPNGLRTSATSAVAAVGSVVDPREYARAAQAAGLDPNGVEALLKVGPSQGARLIVLFAMQRNTLLVGFRAGRSGQPVHEIALPVHHQKLERREAKRLEAATVRALSLASREDQLVDSSSKHVSEPPEVNVSEPVATSDREPEPETEAAPETALAPQSVLADAPEQVAPATEPGEEVSEPEPASNTTQASGGLAAILGFGVGVGERSVRLPTRAGDRRLDTGPFPALDAQLRADAALGTHGLLGAHVHYQTSVALKAAETPAAGGSKQTSLRSHHVELGLTPGYRFTTSESSVSVRLFAGWAFRGLRPVVDAGVPAYSLHGALLRPELRIPIAGGAVTLHFAPELFVILGVSGELRRVGSTAGTGLALGGEGGLDIRLAETLYLALAYRESRATVKSSWFANLSDTERFVTASALLRY